MFTITNCRKAIVSFAAITCAFSALAFADIPGGSGGGDRCEIRFKNVASDLRHWIKEGGHKNLDFGAAQTTADEYATKMLEQIAKTRITCVMPGDKDYPVLVNGRAKECKNFVDDQGISRIICDLEKFYSNFAKPDDESNQYIMAHHEYATLAGFELPDQDNSQYPLSNQITGFLEYQLIQKLAVHPQEQTSDNALVLTFSIDGRVSLWKDIFGQFGLYAYTGQKDDGGRDKYIGLSCARNFVGFTEHIGLYGGRFINRKTFLKEIYIPNGECTYEKFEELAAEIKAKQNGRLILAPNGKLSIR